MPGKSTTDCILALRVLVERRREFRQGMLAAYFNVKKAFHSVQLLLCEYKNLTIEGIRAKLITLLEQYCIEYWTSKSKLITSGVS